MPSAVATSKVTPPGPAGAERLTTKLKVLVPASPSAWETSLTFTVGTGIPPCGVTEKSSMESPWSAPVWSGSDQRSITSVPLGMLRPVMEKVSVTRLAARLPSSAPAAPPVIGLVKSSAGTATPAAWNSARLPVTVGLPTR